MCQLLTASSASPSSPFSSRTAPTSTNTLSRLLYYNLQKAYSVSRETNILLDWGHVHHLEEEEEMATSGLNYRTFKAQWWLLCLQGHSQGVRATTALWAWHSERRTSFLFKDIILPKWSQAVSTLLQHPDLTNAFQRLQINTLGWAAFSHLPLPTPLTRLSSLHQRLAQVWAQQHCPAPRGEGANVPEQAQGEGEEGGGAPQQKSRVEMPTLAGSKHNLAKPNYPTCNPSFSGLLTSDFIGN